MTETTTCPTCAASLPAAAAFCTNCGTKLTPAPPPLPDPTVVGGPMPTDPPQAFQAPPTSVTPPPPPAEPSPTGSMPWQPADDPNSPWAQTPTEPATPTQAQTPGGPPTETNVPAWVHAAQALTTTPPAPPAPPTAVTGAGFPPPATAPASSPNAGGSPAGAILALIGGVLTLVGTFLPWVTNNLSDAGLSGWDLTSGSKGFLLPDGSLLTFDSPDPYALLALGALALFVGVMSFGPATRKVARVLAVVSGLVVITLLVRDWMSLAQVVTDQAPTSFEVSSAFGFYVTIAGGAITALSALMPSKR